MSGSRHGSRYDKYTTGSGNSDDSTIRVYLSDDSVVSVTLNLSHTTDSIRLGDGTDLTEVTASGELTVSDATAQTSLATVAGAVAGTEMQVDVVTSALPTGAATSGLQITGNSSLSSLASTVAGTELQVDIVTSALPAGAATEASVASIDTKVATEATLALLNGKVITADTGNTVVVSSALPAGAATQTSLAIVAGDTTSLDAKTPALGTAFIAGSVPVNVASDQVVPVSATALPLPTGAATETSLATVAGAVSGTEMQVDVVAALPAGTNNIGDVDIASALPAGTNTIGAVDLNRLDVVDFLDTPLLDASSTTIPASASVPLTVVASLAAAVQKVQVADTTGGFLGVYSDPAGTPVLEFIIGPGSDQTIEVSLPATTVLGVRNMDNATITTGNLAINFMG